MTPEEKQAAEQRAYGLTIAQVNQCIEWHNYDRLEYAASITRAAVNRLTTYTAFNQCSPAQLKELDALRMLLNRVDLAHRLQVQDEAIKEAAE